MKCFQIIPMMMKIKGGIGETSIKLLHIVVHLIYVSFVLFIWTNHSS